MSSCQQSLGLEYLIGGCFFGICVVDIWVPGPFVSTLA